MDNTVKKTDINPDGLRAMSDGQFLAHLRLYPYRSQWTDGDAWQYAEYYLTHLNGRRYATDGNPEAFTNSIR